jgi:tetratricopeptide (TPR) repeat protein
MNDLVRAPGERRSANEKSSPAQLVQALLSRGRYFKQTGRPEQAAADVVFARWLAWWFALDDPDVLVESAELAQTPAELERARGELTRGLDKHVRAVNLYLALAGVHVRANERGKAVACLRRGLQVLPGSGELQWNLAELLLRGGDIEEAGKIITRLRQRGFTPVLVEYLTAHAAAAAKQWLRAATALERTQAHLSPWPDLVRDCNLLLGRCWEQLGDAERQQAAYRRVVKADPLSVPGCLGLGAALEALGKTEEALQVYQRILPKQPEVAIIVARLALLRNLTLPAKERDWKGVEELLRQADRASPNSAVVATLRAEMLAARGRLDQAVKEIQDACKQRPEEVGLWAALASLESRRGKPADALAVLDQAARKLGNKTELRLARLTYLAKLGLKELRQSGAEVERDLSRLPVEEQRRLLRGLAEAYQAAGDRATSRALWDRLAALQPDDLRVQLIRFGLALDAGDSDAGSRVVAEIKRVEGSDGTLWRYARVRECLWKARRGDKAALDEAHPLLAALAVRRPGWSRLAVCEAELNELAGKPAAALAAYLRAVELGERDPQVVLRAAALLSACDRSAEADKLLRKLPEEARAQAGLRRLAAQVSLRLASSPEDYDKALAEARRAVAADSNNFRDHVWLGQMAWAAGHTDEAVSSLRRAVALAETRPEPWVALVRCLTWLGQKDRAEEAIRQAEKKLPRERGRVALAHCYAAVGQDRRAEELYHAALKDTPDDLAVLANLADFYLLRGRVEAADPHLRRIIRLKVGTLEETAARRALALALAAKEDPRLAHQALVVLGVLDKEGQLTPPPERQTPEDLRARALVLGRSRSLRLRREAVRLIEKLGRQEFSSEAALFFLAELYESVGDWPKARQVLLSLATAHGKNPPHLARYTRALLRHGEGAEAAVWVKQLDEAAPKGLETMELKARVLAATGRRDEAVRLVRGYADSKGARLDLAAGLLEEIGATQEADALYQKLLAGFKQPLDILLQARFLGRRGKTAEALALCEKAWASCPAEAVSAACVAVLYTGGGSEGQTARVARRLEEAVRTAPRSVQLKADLAAVRNLQGQFDEAAVLYRQILEGAPKSVASLNNLAYLLALRGSADEALTLIERALAVEGPVATLLDTRALVHLARGKPELAIKDLEEASVTGQSATRYFHLAQAHQAARNHAAAVSALRKARDLGLSPARVHPLERKLCERLLAALSPG